MISLGTCSVRVLFDIRAPGKYSLVACSMFVPMLVGYDPSNIGSLMPQKADEMSRVDVEMRS